MATGISRFHRIRPTFAAVSTVIAMVPSRKKIVLVQPCRAPLGAPRDEPPITHKGRRVYRRRVPDPGFRTPPGVAWLRDSAEGRAWLTALPALLDEVAARWWLTLGAPRAARGGRRAVVAPPGRAVPVRLRLGRRARSDRRRDARRAEAAVPGPRERARGDRAAGAGRPRRRAAARGGPGPARAAARALRAGPPAVRRSGRRAARRAGRAAATPLDPTAAGRRHAQRGGCPVARRPRG